MRGKILIIFCIILFQAVVHPAPGFAVSTAVKTQFDYMFTLDVLRNLRIFIENFGTEEQKTKYEEIKKLFNDASESYYAQSFSVSHQKYFGVKERLSELLEIIAGAYLKRTREILDSTSKNSFDIILKYGKNSGLKKYLSMPYDPIEGIKPIKEDEYHFFYDKEAIETYLRSGYKRLELAKSVFEDPELKIVKEKKNKTSSNLDFIIDRYWKTISNCRVAKQYGIEIHKILKINMIGEILRKYNLTSQALSPIFDDRIPEEYKIDANDNLRLIHSIEKERLTKKTK
ncbi:MAG: hypothetical protein EPN93_02385 [Spirochaetes bacterium]|nr:MAG: hypothetical protein EPN93_02385 [Spirochaetota bacterium]